MLTGDEIDPLHWNALETIRGLYDWVSWEADTYKICGCFVQQKQYGNIEVDQTDARAIQTFPITAHKRRHQHEVPSRRGHHHVITKRSVLGWFARP